MKLKPVRVCDVSRILRISSASLIDFLKQNGYSVVGDYLSPLSSRMVELIQTGMHEGPPLSELNPALSQAEEWEKLNPDLVQQLHLPPPPPPKPEEELRERRPRKSRLPRISFQPAAHNAWNGSFILTPLDLEIIQRALELSDDKKLAMRDYLRRRTILKAISQME
ncbi:MAG: hypothetical protein C4524_08355 [Candidatus Zixiibacteriota bacterium]|nr:MAG: hypothetical protein C4524_08355 [candidate division Zixibacteria bacterium]